VKKANADLPKAVRLAGNTAAEIVVKAAKPRVPVQSGRAASTIRASSTRSEARVSEGGARAAYMPWLDFGGRVGRKHSVSRPFIKKGRYVWAAYADHIPQVQTALEESLADVARSAGLEVDLMPGTRSS
jgi:hypothetical protein